MPKTIEIGKCATPVDIGGNIDIGDVIIEQIPPSGMSTSPILMCPPCELDADGNPTGVHAPGPSYAEVICKNNDGGIDVLGAFVDGRYDPDAVIPADYVPCGSCTLPVPAGFVACDGCRILEDPETGFWTIEPVRVCIPKVEGVAVPQWFDSVSNEWADVTPESGVICEACPVVTSRCAQFVHLEQQALMFGDYTLSLPAGDQAAKSPLWCIESFCLPDGTECVVSIGVLDPWDVAQPVPLPDWYGDEMVKEEPCSDDINIFTDPVTNGPATVIALCAAPVTTAAGTTAVPADSAQPGWYGPGTYVLADVHQVNIVTASGEANVTEEIGGKSATTYLGCNMNKCVGDGDCCGPARTVTVRVLVGPVLIEPFRCVEIECEGETSG